MSVTEFETKNPITGELTYKRPNGEVTTRRVSLTKAGPAADKTWLVSGELDGENRNYRLDNIHSFTGETTGETITRENLIAFLQKNA